MKNLIIRRLVLSLAGSAFAALTFWLSSKGVPPEVAASIIGLLTTLIIWGLSVWQGKPMAEMQRMLFPDGIGGKADGLAGEKTIEAFIEAVNNPEIHVRRAREVAEPDSAVKKPAKFQRPQGSKML